VRIVPDDNEMKTEIKRPNNKLLKKTTTKNDKRKTHPSAKDINTTVKYSALSMGMQTPKPTSIIVAIVIVSENFIVLASPSSTPTLMLAIKKPYPRPSPRVHNFLGWSDLDMVDCWLWGGFVNAQRLFLPPHKKLILVIGQLSGIHWVSLDIIC